MSNNNHKCILNSCASASYLYESVKWSAKRGNLQLHVFRMYERLTSSQQAVFAFRFRFSKATVPGNLGAVFLNVRSNTHFQSLY